MYRVQDHVCLGKKKLRGNNNSNETSSAMLGLVHFLNEDSIVAANGMGL